jgi:GTPase SAR1 family protein
MRKYENTGEGDQVNIESVGQYIAAPPTLGKRHPALVKLLDKVKDEVEERFKQRLDRYLTNSLGSEANSDLINLEKQMEPYQVNSPWSMELSLQEREPLPLPPNTSIIEVFEKPEVSRKLLILGEPGSGKTTTLLELAQSLLERAVADSAEPIPVLLNLSAWKDPKQPIFDWLLEELKSKYGVRQDLGQQWLEAHQLIPFLDGLDEVATVRQGLCAQAVNDWLQGDVSQEPMGVVVCCRRQEYEVLVRQNLYLEQSIEVDRRGYFQYFQEVVVRQNLYLQNSISLQPLTDTQISDYLTQFDLNGVWGSVQTHPSLRELLQKPLFLSIFGFVTTARKFDAEDWQQFTSESAQIEYLFDSYWDAVMEQQLVDRQQYAKGIKSKTYRKKAFPHRSNVRRALVFAARGMERTSQTDLLIEKIQPTWLLNNRQEWIYRAIVGLINGLFAGLIGGVGGIVGLIVGLFGGIIGGIMAGTGDIVPIESIQISMSREVRREIVHSLRKNLILGLIIGLIYGLVYGLVFGLVFGLIVGLICGLIFGLVFSLIEGFKTDIEDRIAPNQGIKNSRQNMFILAGTGLLVAIPLKLLLEHLLANVLPTSQILLVVRISLLTFIWLIVWVGGGQALLQHFALRIVLAWNGYAPYRYDKLLDYCTERLLLQRIGGRYRFMHKLLQEHFAKMPLD